MTPPEPGDRDTPPGHTSPGLDDPAGPHAPPGSPAVPGPRTSDEQYVPAAAGTRPSPVRRAPADAAPPSSAPPSSAPPSSTQPSSTPPLPWPAVRAGEPERSEPGPAPHDDPARHRTDHHRTAPHRTARYGVLDRGPLTPAPGFGPGWEPLPPRTDALPGPGGARRRTAVAAAALALVLIAGTAIVAGVLLGGGAAAPAPPDRAGAPGDVTGTPPGGQDVAAGATLVDGAPFGTDPLRFRSPTANIGCVLDADGARCDVTERQWRLPPAPADCTAGWGAGLALTGTAPAGPTCGGNAVAAPSAAPLGYGQALRGGDVTCVSRRTGIECRNAVTGHGFSAARASFDAY